MKTTEQIWHEYQKKLSSFLKRKVAEDVAEDLLQDVYVKIHTRIDSIKEDKKLASWLYQITRNTVIDYYRLKRPLNDLPGWIEQPEPDEEDLVRQGLSSCLESMMKELPDKYRKAVQLSEIESKTQKEVAEMEKISLSGAKSRVQRGRALLKTMLYDCCQIEINKNNQVIGYEKKVQDCKYC